MYKNEIVDIHEKWGNPGPAKLMSHVGPSVGSLDLCLIWSTCRAQEIMKGQGRGFKGVYESRAGILKIKTGKR